MVIQVGDVVKMRKPHPCGSDTWTLTRVGADVKMVCSKCGHMVNIKDAWGDVLKFAGLSGWRLHDLRHAFASAMVNGGASLPVVGKILGHSNASTTQRYAHLEENPAKKAAEAAAETIQQAIQERHEKTRSDGEAE